MTLRFLIYAKPYGAFSETLLVKLGRKCKYNVTLRCVRVITVAVEKQ